MEVQRIPKRTVSVIEPKKFILVDKDKYHQKRVAAYCRVSTDSEEQLTSYQNQMRFFCILLCCLYPVEAPCLAVVQVSAIIKGVVIGFRFRVKAVSEDEQVFFVAAFRKSLDLLHPAGDEVEFLPLGRIALIAAAIADDHLERALDMNQLDDLIRPVLLGVLMFNDDLQIPQMRAQL